MKEVFKGSTSREVLRDVAAFIDHNTDEYGEIQVIVEIVKDGHVEL